MIEQAQGILSKSMGAVGSSGATIKSLIGSHPIGLGVVIGLGAYYVVNKYWLNDDEEIDIAEAAESEEDAPA